jgi:hypothetical protein
MITIIHGDNSVMSRRFLQTELEQFKRANKIIRSFAAADLSMATLTEALQTDSLFGNENVVVIERLFRLRSKRTRDQFIECMCQQTQLTLYLWEDTSITATSLKLLQKAKPIIQVFKTSPVVFSAMDLLGNPREQGKLLTLLHESYIHDSPEFVFSMLARQIRLLIAVVEHETSNMKPFVLGKLQRQQRYFTLSKLLALHHELLTIDLSQKQSTGLLSLEQQLDLFALKCAQ